MGCIYSLYISKNVRDRFYFQHLYISIYERTERAGLLGNIIRVPPLPVKGFRDEKTSRGFADASRDVHLLQGGSGRFMDRPYGGKQKRLRWTGRRVEACLTVIPIRSRRGISGRTWGGRRSSRRLRGRRRRRCCCRCGRRIPRRSGRVPSPVSPRWRPPRCRPRRGWR